MYFLKKLSKFSFPSLGRRSMQILGLPSSESSAAREMIVMQKLWRWWWWWWWCWWWWLQAWCWCGYKHDDDDSPLLRALLQGIVKMIVMKNYDDDADKQDNDEHNYDIEDEINNDFDFIKVCKVMWYRSTSRNKGSPQ